MFFKNPVLNLKLKLRIYIDGFKPLIKYMLESSSSGRFRRNITVFF